MKKIFIVILIVCLIICGCSPFEQKDNSSNISNSSDIDNDADILKNNNSIITQRNQENLNNHGFLCETENYCYYLNVYDGYTLCRYNKGNEKVENIFDDNIGKFLHHIQIYNDELYFVTKTQNDEIPCLYKSDLDGKNLVKVLSNVGDYYFLKEEKIYYSSYREENGDIFYIYRFDIKTGKKVLLVNRETADLNMIGDTIYYVDVTFDSKTNYSSGAICALDTVSGKVTQMAMPDKVSFICYLHYYNNKLYFECLKSGRRGSVLASIDLATCEFSEVLYIGEEWDLSEFALLSEDEIYCSAREMVSVDQDGNNVWEYCVLKIENNKHSKYTVFDIPQNGGIIGIFEEKPIIFDISKGDNAKIHGAEKLNVRVTGV